MTKKHSYKNPSKARHDLAKVEAQVTEGKKYYDEQGWEISPPTVSYTHLRAHET